MQHRIILPGATTLTRLISEVREKATLRLWNKLALIPSAEQRSQLEMLLGPTDCSRLSLLESLKKGPVTISGPAFNEAIERWKTLNDFGLHAENLSTLPAVRLKNLARYAGMTSVFNIARMSPQKRMAVLVAFVLAWETLALDDALDVLDAMLAVIIRDARKIGQKKRLRSLKDLEFTDDQLIDFMLQHPILINRPIVVTPLGTKLCRPSEVVLDILPDAQKAAFTKEDGEKVVDDSGKRLK
ncbi:transposase [Klebsiella pneumoniae]|nr:transposase [Klebsiella pneumoniae]